MESSPKVYLLTYADQNYKCAQESLCVIAVKSKQFDRVIAYDRARLLDKYPEFCQRHKAILDQPRGAGYWLWKPHLIHEMLKTLEDGDILLYVDCGDLLADTRDLRSKLISIMADKDIYLTDGAYKNSAYTKRDCFVVMKCDEEKYHNAIQVEAGIILCKAGQKAREYTWEWRYNCMFSQALTDEPNHLGSPNLPDFIDHRHDQSVLTNLKVKNNLPSGNLLRENIFCNQNQ